MTTVTSGNPSSFSWNDWRQKLDEKHTASTSHHQSAHQEPTHNKETCQRQRHRSNSSSHFTQHKYDAAPPPAKPAVTPPGNEYRTNEFVWTDLVNVPRSASGAPVTHEFDNGNVKITSSPMHQGSFNGTPTPRNKVTIETGHQDDHIEIKTLQSGGVVAEINGKAYALPIENVGAIAGLLEINTNGGEKDKVNIAKNIWFETQISLNDDHRVSGRNGYTSAPESSDKKASDAIPVASQMKQEGDSKVFKHDAVTISYDQNKYSDHPGDGVTQIQTGDGDDNVRISAADDGSLIADINGENFLLPVKNDPTGRSRLFLQTQKGEAHVTIDSNVKNFSYINLGADKSGTVYTGGGFVSGPQETKQDQQYRNQNYNPV
jgi:hypothetical protein